MASLIGIARLAHDAPVLQQKRAAQYLLLPAYEMLTRCTSAKMPFEWTINPYRGCEFGCKYCYARYTHEYMELREPDEFETKIFAKQWHMPRFRERLRKLDPAERIAIGSATDPYQPAERRYKLTRSILEAFSTLRGRELSITTKSNLVTRDLDLFAEIARANKLYVNITITTTDADLARLIEPGAPRPDLRLEAVHLLSAAGIRCGVLGCPVLPLINDSEEQIDRLASAAAEAGASYLGGSTVFLMPSAWNVFLPFLEERFPHLAPRYKDRFSRNAYLKGEYPEQVKARFRKARIKYGMTSDFPEYQPPEWPGETQLKLGF